jgi:Co/Zn/Cd efflux system component
MAGCCEHDACAAPTAKVDPAWRRALWVALIINAAMFLAEAIAGFAAGSSALQADSLDFLGDGANYAISLGVAGLSLGVRARTTFLKGATLLALGGAVIASAAWRVWTGDEAPEATTMAAVAAVALLANVAVAAMLFRFRRGDSNMRSVWICTRNDVIGNIAVVLAAVGVFGTGSLWPDILVAAIMAVLAITGGWAIMRQASVEIRLENSVRTAAQ